MMMIPLVHSKVDGRTFKNNVHHHHYTAEESSKKQIHSLSLVFFLVVSWLGSSNQKGVTFVQAFAPIGSNFYQQRPTGDLFRTKRQHSDGPFPVSNNVDATRNSCLLLKMSMMELVMEDDDGNLVPIQMDDGDEEQKLNGRSTFSGISKITSPSHYLVALERIVQQSQLGRQRDEQQEDLRLCVVLYHYDSSRNTIIKNADKRRKRDDSNANNSNSKEEEKKEKQMEKVLSSLKAIRQSGSFPRIMMKYRKIAQHYQKQQVVKRNDKQRTRADIQFWFVDANQFPQLVPQPYGQEDIVSSSESPSLPTIKRMKTRKHPYSEVPHLPLVEIYSNGAARDGKSLPRLVAQLSSKGLRHAYNFDYVLSQAIEEILQQQQQQEEEEEKQFRLERRQDLLTIASNERLEQLQKLNHRSIFGY